MAGAQFEELPANATRPGNWTPPAANIVTALNLLAHSALINKLNVTGLLQVAAADVTGTLNATQINTIGLTVGVGRSTLAKQINRALLGSITNPLVTLAPGSPASGVGRWVAMDSTGVYCLAAAFAGDRNMVNNSTTIMAAHTNWQPYGDGMWRPDVSRFLACSGNGAGLMHINPVTSSMDTGGQRWLPAHGRGRGGWRGPRARYQHRELHLLCSRQHRHLQR